jgi:hypothetical protein
LTQPVPPREALRIAPEPLGLSFPVKDGLLVIDSRSATAVDRLEEVERKLDQVLKAVEAQRPEAKRD